MTLGLCLNTCVIGEGIQCDWNNGPKHKLCVKYDDFKL